jgi:transposase
VTARSTARQAIAKHSAERGRSKGGMHSKLHGVTDAVGRALRMFLTAGPRSDYIGARALLRDLPDAKHMLADRGHDADWHREASEDKGISPCIPSRISRKEPLPQDANRYRKRHKIENSFARLDDWWRIATRFDSCPKGLPFSLRFGCRAHVLVVNPAPRISPRRSCSSLQGVRGSACVIARLHDVEIQCRVSCWIISHAARVRKGYNVVRSSGRGDVERSPPPLTMPVKRDFRTVKPAMPFTLQVSSGWAAGFLRPMRLCRSVER